MRGETRTADPEESAPACASAFIHRAGRSHSLFAHIPMAGMYAPPAMGKASRSITGRLTVATGLVIHSVTTQSAVQRRIHVSYKPRTLFGLIGDINTSLF